jgi:hypothetical protein
VLFAAAVAVNTALAMSSPVGTWWGSSTDGTSRLPPVLSDVVASRPETSDGDVHLVMWFAASALLLLAVRRWPRRLVVLVLLWTYTGVLEVAQSAFTVSRRWQWSDLGSNALGIAAAGVGMAVADHVRTRRRLTEARAAGDESTSVVKIV